MGLICPESNCPNHKPHTCDQWFDYHGSYQSCEKKVQRYRCRRCGRTFSERTLSIDYWTHSHIDYRAIIALFTSGFSLRALARYFNTTIKTIQNRIGRLARTIIPTLSVIQHSIALKEHLVADGLENFCVSQDFPNNIHILVGKDSQYLYGFNYALLRRKGKKTDKQRLRCQTIYKKVDFTRHTITRTFRELVAQMKLVNGAAAPLALYTDKKEQYQLALRTDETMLSMARQGRFKHLSISSQAARTRSNNLFAANYMDREVRKDVAEFHRETVCFGRNVCNMLERLCVYFYHHNFIKIYRIAVAGENRSHAEVAGVDDKEVERIREDVVTRRRFLSDEKIEQGGFFDELWRRRIPTPLAQRDECLPNYLIA